MFLGDLNDPEQRAFLDLARLMIYADGRVAKEEREMLCDAREEMGLEAIELYPETDKEIEECCRAVASQRARAIILLELASFAHVDGDLDERERSLLKEIAAIWGLDEISVIRIEDWACKRVQLSLEAAEIMHEVDTFFSPKNEIF